ncbi:hypothetical protein Tco_0256847 [Tanacetum coccineum]
MPTSELRRSGRVKSKSSVVEENTASDAYSVDDESSGDDFVDGNGKGIEVGNRVVKRGSGSNVSHSSDDKGKRVMESNSGAVKKRKKSDIIGDDKEKGESSKATTSKPKKEKGKSHTYLLDFKVDGIPSKLGFYVANNFNANAMEIKLKDTSIVTTHQLIGEILGIKNEGVDITAEVNANDDEMVKDWDAQFKKGKEITLSYLKSLIRKSKVADMNFKLNFIVLFTSVMSNVKPKGICDLSVLHNISRKIDLGKINWCEYVWRCLKKCKEGWKSDMSNSFFLGPITCLAMLYVDGTVCNEFNVGLKRPPTSFWIMELLKEREYEEINAGGTGKGELQGPFVEEDDPMPEDEDGFLWKLNKYVENIRKERDRFERTFVEASNVLRGNSFIADVYQQYCASLHYKNVGNEGKSSDQNGDNNDEPQQVNTLQEAVDNNSKDYDSPTFALGLATQKEVFTRVDKVVEEFESSKKGNDFEAPSFSFGVTQDFEMVLSLETLVTDRNTPVLGSAHQLDPINAVPVSMCKPVLKDEDVVHGRGKRNYTKSQAARSPFMSRVTDINATESKDEKRVEKFLLNKIKIDQSAVLFQNETRTKASRKQMESLVNGENIDNAALDAWFEYLNSLENLRGENSMSRFFLPTFIVKNECPRDKKMFGIESKANTSITNFLMDAETVNERVGRKNMINLVDLVSIHAYEVSIHAYDSVVSSNSNAAPNETHFW